MIVFQNEEIKIILNDHLLFIVKIPSGWQTCYDISSSYNDYHLKYDFDKDYSYLMSKIRKLTIFL